LGIEFEGTRHGRRSIPFVSAGEVVMSWSIGGGLEDKGVVVTGAGGGIGRAVAVAFASAGARVCAVDVRQDPVEEVVASLPDPDRHQAVVLDLLDLSSHEGIFRRAQETFGRFDVLAHLAAVLRRRYEIDDITEEDWDLQLDVNLKATFFLNRAAAKVLREQGRGGRIINLTSQSWWTGGFGGAVAYASSKGGIVSLSRGLARSLAPYGITVNTVAPGFVDTPMLVTGVPAEQLEEWKRMVPLGQRFTTPEEVAAPILFLASDGASHITSTTLNVTGGQLTY
jgi:NAD(P)-dependent dehydrogenase (short-subunit alcohol dehydrogenase family)